MENLIIYKKKFEEYWGSGKYIKRAIKKHGIERFKKEIIVEGNFNINLVNDLEKHYIRLYNSVVPYGYNIRTGGQGGTTKKHKVYQYTVNGEFVKEWDSINSVVKFYNCDKTSISSVANLKSRYHTAHGFIWSYTKNNIQERLDKMKVPKHYNIYVYDEKELVKIFTSYNDCADFLEIRSNHISARLRNKTGNWVKNYYVSRIKVENIPPNIRPTICKPVIKINENNQRIKFNTIQDAAKDANVTNGYLSLQIRKHGFYKNYKFETL